MFDMKTISRWTLNWACDSKQSRLAVRAEARDEKMLRVLESCVTQEQFNNAAAWFNRLESGKENEYLAFCASKKGFVYG